MDLNKKNLVTGEPSIKSKSASGRTGKSGSGSRSSNSSGKRARADSSVADSGMKKTRIMVEIKVEPDPVFAYEAVSSQAITQVCFSFISTSDHLLKFLYSL